MGQNVEGTERGNTQTEGAQEGQHQRSSPLLSGITAMKLRRTQRRSYIGDHSKNKLRDYLSGEKKSDKTLKVTTLTLKATRRPWSEAPRTEVA